jgi:transposase
MPARYEAVLRPTMKFVAIKTVEQLDLQGPHRVRERLVCQRTRVINQVRAFLLERGIAVPRCLIGMEACVGAHHLSRQLKALGHEIETLSEQDDGAKRLMTVPGIGPITFDTVAMRASR